MIAILSHSSSKITVGKIFQGASQYFEIQIEQFKQQKKTRSIFGMRRDKMTLRYRCLNEHHLTYNCPTRICHFRRLCQSLHTPPRCCPLASSRQTPAQKVLAPHRQEACHYDQRQPQRANLTRGRIHHSDPDILTLHHPLRRRSSSHFPTLAPPACHTRARH